MARAPPHQAADRKLETVDLALLDFEHLLLFEQPLFFLERVFGIIANVTRQHAVFQFDNFFRDDVEQVTIVRNDDHRAGIIGNQLFEECFAVEIEMIIRLVEQQEFRLFDQQFR